MLAEELDTLEELLFQTSDRNLWKNFRRFYVVSNPVYFLSEEDISNGDIFRNSCLSFESMNF